MPIPMIAAIRAIVLQRFLEPFESVGASWPVLFLGFEFIQREMLLQEPPSEAYAAGRGLCTSKEFCEMGLAHLRRGLFA